MATFHRVDGGIEAYVKGAPGCVAGLCALHETSCAAASGRTGPRSRRCWVSEPCTSWPCTGRRARAMLHAAPLGLADWMVVAAAALMRAVVGQLLEMREKVPAR